MLDEILMFGGECGGEVAINIKFADNFSVRKDWDDDFRFRFERAREIAGVSGDVVDNDSLPARRGRVMAPSNAPSTSTGG